jgi:mono/diheme cytochrome c family protein
MQASKFLRSLFAAPTLLLLLLLCGIAAPATAAPAKVATPGPTALPRPRATMDKRAAAGLQVYLKNYCGICHTLAAAGTRGTFGPPHDHIATDAKQRIADPSYSGEAKTVVQYLRESILSPKVYAAPGYAYTSHPMPEYSYLPKAEVDALIYFLLQQK